MLEGFWLGPLLGLVLGAYDGFADGSGVARYAGGRVGNGIVFTVSEGTWLGMLEGFWLGTLLGLVLGAYDGFAEGSGVARYVGG